MLANVKWLATVNGARKLQVIVHQGSWVNLQPPLLIKGIKEGIGRDVSSEEKTCNLAYLLPRGNLFEPSRGMNKIALVFRNHAGECASAHSTVWLSEIRWFARARKQ